MYCPAPKLSLTGCMDPTHPTQFASNVIPYEVNSPLWSDSAYKSRGFVLPAGGKIHVKDCAANPSECKYRGPGDADTGKWVLPVGSAMIKTFMFGGKLVETRLLFHPDAYNWNGYTYQWNETQTEATIVPDARAEALFNVGADGGVAGADGGVAGADAGVVDWHYPSRTDCNDCHTQQAGGILGPEMDQMNRVVGGVNQLDHFVALGLFEDASIPTKPYPSPLMLPYSGQLGTADTTAPTLDPRARSYLHANCAHCHRPDADQNNFDLRFGVSFKNTMVCNGPLTMTALDVPDAVVLSPGQPGKSAIWLRMDAPISDDKSLHMPRIGVHQFDTQGLQLISDWITSIKACP
jgi:mono/diheme cytochrome c family protein